MSPGLWALFLGNDSAFLACLRRAQGVCGAFSAGYHKLVARQKLVRMCRGAALWLIRCCTRVLAVDVYAATKDLNAQTTLIHRVFTTSRGRVVACDSTTPAFRQGDNLFLLVSSVSFTVTSPCGNCDDRLSSVYTMKPTRLARVELLASFVV